MSNITLSIQDDLLKAGRDYAQKHHTSLNALVRDLLKKMVTRTPSSHWMDECFQSMDEAKVSLKKKKKWKREDLYDV